MWPVNGPAEAVTFRRCEHLIFLGIIEILDIEPRLVLPKRRGDQAALAIGFERSEIVLEASYECDVPDRPGRRQCIQQVAHHRRVDQDILCLRFLSKPRTEENMRGTQIAQRRAEGRRIQQISGDRQHTVDINFWPACQPVHRPSPLQEMSGKIVDHYAGCSCDKCGTFHLLTLCDPFEIGRRLSASNSNLYFVMLRGSSAFGTKRTSRARHRMPAYGP